MKVKIGDLTKIKTGKLDANASSEDGQYPFFTCSREPLKISTYSYDCECVLVAGNGDLNVKYYNGKFDAYQRTYIIEDNGSGKLYMPYLYYFMEGYIEELRKQAIGGVIKYIKLGNLTDALIELPSVDEQKSIVEILVKVKGILEKRNDELNALDDLIRARFVEMFGDPLKNDKGMPTVMGEALFKLSNGKTLPNSKRFSEGIPAYGGNGISWYTDEILCDYDTIIVGRVGFQSGNVHLAKAPLWVTDNAMYISSINSRDCDIRFLCALMEHIDFTRYQDAGDLKKITQKPFMQMQYLMPPMLLQKQYIAFVEQVDKSKVVVQKALDEAQTLFDSLMQEYFG
ncbi:restriction endonuclease subunit S [Evtepia gabavorous]|uniref:restriction endonuclease subunit S n=1 Tax=Evtepia gabavorous TaxID=2211183 RepID=UPI003A8F482B